MTFEAPSVAQSAMAAAMSGCASSMWAVFTMLRCDVDLWVGRPCLVALLAASVQLQHACTPVSGRPQHPASA